jgi:lysophospholipase
MHDEKYARERFGAGHTSKAPLTLPSLGPDKKRIVYTIYEYEPLLDSSNMTMDDWISIAKDLRVSNCCKNSN